MILSPPLFDFADDDNLPETHAQWCEVCGFDPRQEDGRRVNKEATLRWTYTDGRVMFTCSNLNCKFAAQAFAKGAGVKEILNLVTNSQ